MEQLPQTISEFDRLMALEKIEHRHLDALGADEKEAFMDKLYNKLAKLEGKPRNALVEKTLAVLDNDFIWDYNHDKIAAAIEEYIFERGTTPSKAYLAITCGLNRKTVSAHLQAFSSSEARAGQLEAINMVKQKVISKVTKAALRGDLKAAKLFLEVTKAPKDSESTVNNQNSYVQINKTVINQQIIQQLKPEQLQLIEQIIAGSEGK